MGHPIHSMEHYGRDRLYEVAMIGSLLILVALALSVGVHLIVRRYRPVTGSIPQERSITAVVAVTAVGLRPARFSRVLQSLQVDEVLIVIYGQSSREIYRAIERIPLSIPTHSFYRPRMSKQEAIDEGVHQASHNTVLILDPHAMLYGGALGDLLRALKEGVGSVPRDLESPWYRLIGKLSQVLFGQCGRLHNRCLMVDTLAYKTGSYRTVYQDSAIIE